MVGNGTSGDYLKMQKNKHARRLTFQTFFSKTILCLFVCLIFLIIECLFLVVCCLTHLVPYYILNFEF